MEPELITLPELTVVGYRTAMPMAEAINISPALWDDVRRDGRLDRLFSLMSPEAQPPGLLGVSVTEQVDGREEFAYIIAVAGSPKDGLDTLRVPAATWAVFDAKADSPVEIQKIITAVWTDWLPASEYQAANAPMMETYLEPPNQFVWLAVEPRD
jgi:AraC family transcriptional regulator